jgi:hypothetical protein
MVTIQRIAIFHILFLLLQQTNKEKLTMSTKEDENGKESKEPDYDEDKDQIEEKQEEKTGEQETTNHVF